MINLPIVSERVVVRRFTPTDIDGYLSFMLDEDSTRFLAFNDEQKTESGARDLFFYVLESYESPDIVHAYAIADAATDAYLGSCGFAPYDDGIVECYYAINCNHRGKGFAVEAMGVLVAELTTSVEVRAYCHAENFAAHAVAKKCGMTPLGRGQNRNSGLEGQVFVARKSP